MLAAAASLAAGHARASNPVITVTLDDDSTNACATTGTAPCSLRDAIKYANATVGADTIAFDIAPGGLHKILPATPYPAITEALTIDGYTQPANGGGTAHPNTLAVGNDALILIEIDGSGVSAVPNGLFDVEAGPGAIRGLDIHDSPNGSGAIRVAGSNVTIAGNFVGTDPTGATFLANVCNGVRIEGSNNIVGGASPAARNVISATTGCAINLILSGGDNNTVQNNYIGTNAAGNVGSSELGIDIADGSSNNEIGGTSPGEGNLISGNSIAGIRIRTSTTTANHIEGNLFGTKGSGTGSLPNYVAVQISEGAHDNVVGGDSAAATNVIAHNSHGGVVLESNAGSGNAIQSNSIFANGGLGIDLGDDGVTANDPLDADTGPNNRQNFPILTAVSENSVEGFLKSAPNTSYTIQFFANTACHSSGYGEGESLVQTTVVSTNAAGLATFGVSLTVPTGQAVTATATDTVAGTSEFSACTLLVPATLAVDGSAGGSSDGNGVFEPGETAAIVPGWHNGTAAGVATAGQASGFGGPAGPTYGTPDAAASYGTLLAGTTVRCSDVPDCYSMSVSAASRPATHWDAAFTETLPGAASQSHVWTLHLGDSFSDVPRAHPFYKRIETVLHAGVTVGCTTTQYCPSQKVPRDQMAIFIARAIAGGGANVPSSGMVNASAYDCSPGGVSLFTDVAPTAPACKSVHYLAAQNVTSGCAASLFCPATLVNRAEMSIFVAKGVVAPGGGGAVPTTYGPDPVTGFSYSCAAGSPNLHFTDISTSDNFCKHAHFLWAKGVISGCSATQYCPAGQVGRDEMAKFLSNAFGLVLYGP